MSPLIDVTNTIIPDIPKDALASLNVHMPSYKPKIIENLPYVPLKDSFLESHAKVSSATSCNNCKHLYSIKKTLACRTCCLNTKEGQTEMSPAELLQRETDMRVPPILFQDSLSHSFLSLDLCSDTGLPNSCVKEKDSHECNTKCGCKTLFTGCSNSVGPPSKSFSSSYQCIACGLELTSMGNLTRHLVYHIYGGLYAASWLTNTMSVLLAPVSNSVVSTYSEPITVVQNSRRPKYDVRPAPNSLRPKYDLKPAYSLPNLSLGSENESSIHNTSFSSV